ncbi:MAG TPA: PDGLE domain-containing protein [Actinomycetes bacterium]|nr:PDGLE domain-containing protein [Actinomycetes bacterium]
MRTSNLRLFLLAGLLVAAGLALFVSGFASSSPDGLNKVAEDHGFAATAKEHLFENGPLAGYAVKGINGDRLSTGVSGLIGVLVTFGLGLALFALVRAMRSGRDRSGPTRAP